MATTLWSFYSSLNSVIPPPLTDLQVTPPQGEYRLVTCAPKPGQRLKKHEENGETFLLKDQDDGRSLGKQKGGGFQKWI